MNNDLFSSKALLNLGVFTTLILGSVWWIQSPLTTSRPRDSHTTKLIEESFPGLNKPFARPWQDPFEPYAEHSSSATAIKDDATLKTIFYKDFENQFRTVRKLPDQCEQLLLMGIMVPGGPFEDRAERRQRIRVALASAMAAGGYAPADTDHLGVFPFQPIPNDNKSTSFKVPYEWFFRLNDDERRRRSFSSAYDRILVFWIPDDHFAVAPLERLARLRWQVNGLVNRLDNVNHVKPPRISDMLTESDFSIFGPWSSTTLKKLFEEAKGASDDLKRHLDDASLTFYNVFSTAPPDMLLPQLNLQYDDCLECAAQRQLFCLQDSNDPRQVFYHTTCSDSYLAKAMKQELKVRGVDFTKDQIALISENDTLYGRSLPKTFHRAFSEGEAQRCLIERFTYLRGLDGRIPQENAKNESGTAKNTGSPSVNPRMSIESRFMPTRKTNRPEGNNQYDYIIRLGEEMRQMEYQTGEPFKGIGILGSDVYDKLLLLQALKPLFPNAVFFTTDLDASYNHPQELEWTKNLLVASTHGLTLNEKYQCGAAPFRFSYQTAVFQAILGATTLPEEETKQLLNSSPARIFEIGWDKAYDLSVPSLVTPWVGKQEKPDTPSTQHVESVHPPQARMHADVWGRYSRQFLAVAFISFIALFVLDWHRKVFRLLGYPFKRCIDSLKPLSKKKEAAAPSPETPASNHTSPSLSTGSTIVLLVLLGLYLICTDIWSVTGEPWYWGAGISVWPSALFRLVAGLTSCVLLVTALSHVRKARYDLCKQFTLTEFERHSLFTWKNFPLALCHVGVMLLNALSSPSDDESEKSKGKGRQSKKNSVNTVKSGNSIADLWQEYRNEMFAHAIIDCLICFGVVAAILYLLQCEGNGHLPFRSDASYWVGTCVWGAAWTLTIMLVFTTFFITRSCCRFIDRMIDVTIDWSEMKNGKTDETVLNGFAKRWGINRWEVTNEDITALTDVYFVAEWTGKISNLVLYPIASVVLLFVAKSSYFDNYGYNPYHYFILIFIGLLIFAPAFQLRSAAGKLRAKRIKSEREYLDYHGRLLDEQTKKKLECAIRDTENLRGGAFEPFLEHPFMQAILLLLGGISLPTFISFMSR